MYGVQAMLLQQSSRFGLDDSSRRAGDVEPLVNGRVDGSRSLVLVLRDLERGGVGAVLAVRDGGVGAAGSESAFCYRPL